MFTIYGQVKAVSPLSYIQSYRRTDKIKMPPNSILGYKNVLS